MRKTLFKLLDSREKMFFSLSFRYKRCVRDSAPRTTDDRKLGTQNVGKSAEFLESVSVFLSFFQSFYLSLHAAAQLQSGAPLSTLASVRRSVEQNRTAELAEPGELFPPSRWTAFRGAIRRWEAIADGGRWMKEIEEEKKTIIKGINHSGFFWGRPFLFSSGCS